MAKLANSDIVKVALALLDEVGLDAFTTRRLAQKLCVASPTLYWHYDAKSALLAAMAGAVLARHHAAPVPPDVGRWRDWFADNARSLRRSLLAYRDGARLHAGTPPSRDDLAQLAPKVAFMERAGFTRSAALMALLAVGQYTLGCVLEHQARAIWPGDEVHGNDTGSSFIPSDITTAITDLLGSSGDEAFDFGLALIIDGLQNRIGD